MSCQRCRSTTEHIGKVRCCSMSPGESGQPPGVFSCPQLGPSVAPEMPRISGLGRLPTQAPDRTSQIAGIAPLTERRAVAAHVRRSKVAPRGPS